MIRLVNEQFFQQYPLKLTLNEDIQHFRTGCNITLMNVWNSKRNEFIASLKLQITK